MAFLLIVEPASGQESTTRGFTLGIHATGASLEVEGGDDGRSNAGGGGMHFGYGLNRKITIFVQGDGAKFDDLTTDDVEGEWTMGHSPSTASGPAEELTILGQGGEPLTFGETLVLHRIVDAIEDVFDFLEDLTDPVDDLVILGILL